MVLGLVLASLIVGGDPSAESAVVAIRARAICGVAPVFSCSATMLSPRAALTAAHCVEDPVGLLEVVTDADATDPDAVGLRIAEAIVVPGVDLAIVVLTEPWGGATMSLGDVPLDAVGRTVEVIGYGDDGTGAVGMRRAGTALVDEVDADAIVLVPGPALTCGGDSGGPIVLEGVIVAVTSYGDPDCARTTTAVRVDAHRDFLDDAVVMASTIPEGVPGPGTPDCGDDDSGGCRAGGRSRLGAVLLLLALIAACKSTKPAAAKGPCGADVQHGAAPPDGDLMWCADATGAKHGAMREWWPDGTPKSETTYVHGKQHGHFTRWSEDGTKQEEGDMADGLRVGRWTEWYEDGIKKREADHDGATVRWTLYEEMHGAKWIEGAFQHQREHGHFVEWYPDGKKTAEGEFVDGQKTGTWSYWNADGSVSLEERGAYASGAFVQ